MRSWFLPLAKGPERGKGLYSEQPEHSGGEESKISRSPVSRNEMAIWVFSCHAYPAGWDRWAAYLTRPAPARNPGLVRLQRFWLDRRSRCILVGVVLVSVGLSVHVHHQEMSAEGLIKHLFS